MCSKSALYKYIVCKNINKVPDYTIYIEALEYIKEKYADYAQINNNDNNLHNLMEQHKMRNWQDYITTETEISNLCTNLYNNKANKTSDKNKHIRSMKALACILKYNEHITKSEILKLTQLTPN